MSIPALDNLVRIGQLKAEPRSEAEIERMLTEDWKARKASLRCDEVAAAGGLRSLNWQPSNKERHHKHL